MQRPGREVACGSRFPALPRVPRGRCAAERRAPRRLRAPDQRARASSETLPRWSVTTRSAIEEKWQGAWAEARAFNVAEPRGPATRRAQDVRARDAPVPVGRTAHGARARTTCWARSSRTSGAGAASACCGRWASTRSACPPRTPRSGKAATRARSPRATSPRSARQMQRIGWAIDWTRELSTHEPEYYRWTQWLFLRFFERGLAYRKAAPVKWCPNDQTVLANEQVIDGRCERCGAVVEAKNLEQWLFRITAYAERLLDEMALLESWPERVLTMQRNWIGRSEGAEVVFRVDGPRPRAAGLHDAAGHALRRNVLRARARAPADRASSSQAPSTSDEVLDYVRHAAATQRSRSARRRRRTASSPAGSWSNPVNDEPDPDLGRRLRARRVRHRRDHGRAGARRARPRVRGALRPADRQVVGRRTARRGGRAYVAHADDECSSTRRSSPGCRGGGEAARSSSGSAERGLGRATIGYRLRDWLLSRQRYWGAPIPIVYCDGCGIVPVPDEELPGAAPGDRRLPAEGPLAARGRRGLGAHDVPLVRRRGAARDRHDGHVRRLVLVLHPLRRPAERPRAVRSRARRLLAAGRPVHRRRGARDPAPALCALLREGDERPRPRRLPRAVRAALHAGDALSPRREDVEVEGQRDPARRLRGAATAPTRCASISRSSGRSTRTRSGRTPASREWCGFLHRLWRVGARGASTTSPDGHDGHAARPQGACGDREGDRRHRQAVRHEHADRRGDGAREGDLRAAPTTRPHGSPSRPRSR